MEQSGRAGAVHMTAEAAAQLHREGPGGTPRPPLHLTEIKSKGTMLTAWCAITYIYNCIYIVRRTVLRFTSATHQALCIIPRTRTRAYTHAVRRIIGARTTSASHSRGGHPHRLSGRYCGPFLCSEYLFVRLEAFGEPTAALCCLCCIGRYTDRQTDRQKGGPCRRCHCSRVTVAGSWSPSHGR